MAANLFSVPKHEVARIIYEALLNTDTSNLKVIHLVDNTDKILSLVANRFNHISKQKPSNDLPRVTKLDEDVVSFKIHTYKKKELKRLLLDNRIKVFIYHGDITKATVDAILCSNDEGLSCSAGIAKIMANLAGDVYKKRCQEEARRQKLKASDVVPIMTENYGIIINAILPRLTDLSSKRTSHDDGAYKQLMERTFKNAFEEARNYGVSSLAMVPLGAGGLKESTLFKLFSVYALHIMTNNSKMKLRYLSPDYIVL